MESPDFSAVIDQITAIVTREEPLLAALSDTVITQRRNRQHRSIKQILGHLIDSAANNHQRMVRLQYCRDLLFFPDYQQDNDLWIVLQDYQHADFAQLIALWKYYNMHIVQVIKSVDPTRLDSYWCGFQGDKVTLRQMIEGYTEHLKLHIGEIHQLAEGAIAFSDQKIEEIIRQTRH